MVWSSINYLSFTCKGTHIDVEPFERERLRRWRHAGGVSVELSVSPVPFDRHHWGAVQVVIAAEHDTLSPLHRRRHKLYADVVQTPDDV